MRLVFAGTPAFAAVSLAALLPLHQSGEIDIVAVYTQPDRRAGRGKKITPSAVKQLALEASLPVVQPQNFKDPEQLAQLAALQPDLMVVVAYGLLLPQNVLDCPSLGCINVHGSLLPRWRGAAPIQRAIEAGDKQTGVTLMQMTLGLDEGPMLVSEAIDILPSDTTMTLHDRLAELGARLLATRLPDILAQRLMPTAQPAGACYAHKIHKAQALIDWQQDAEQIERRIRAFNPWPVCSSSLHETTIRIHAARTLSAQHCEQTLSADTKPGTILALSVAPEDSYLRVATGQGVLDILTLQKPGGKALAVAEWMRGQSIAVGDCFA